MKNILIGIVLILSLQYGYSLYKTSNNKNIILDIVNVKNCNVTSVHKEDTLMHSHDGEKVFYLKANLICEKEGDIMAEIQYIQGRERNKQGLNIYWSNGSWTKSGVWYHP